MRIDSVTLAAVVGGQMQGPPTFFSGVVLDSRAAGEGDLFVAIKGPNHDGHDFLTSALGKASGALVSRQVPRSELPPDRTLIRVPDTIAALRTFARYVRDTVGFRVVAITGTVGKTTTKEMTAALLAQRFRTSCSAGNHNNGIGLPAEVANMPEDAELAVLEMGMSSPGEIRLLSDLFRPDVAVVTAVTPVHMMSFASLDEVQDAKAEILSGLSREGTFVANADDERSLAIGHRFRGRTVTYGMGPVPRLDVTARGIVTDGGTTRFGLVVEGREHEATLPLPGKHNLSNFLGAAAAAWVLGVSGEEIASAAFVLAAATHRGEIFVTANDVLVYDDSYNSSPAALTAAIEAFLETVRGRRRVAVLGEMRELGKKSEDLHRAAGREIGRRMDILVAVQGHAAALAEAARKAGAPEVHVVESAADAVSVVRSILRPHDAVLVKGSRGVKLDTVVEALRS